MISKGTNDPHVDGPKSSSSVRRKHLIPCLCRRHQNETGSEKLARYGLPNANRAHSLSDLDQN